VSGDTLMLVLLVPLKSLLAEARRLCFGASLWGAVVQYNRRAKVRIAVSSAGKRDTSCFYQI
jgi:hypothetical protein